MEIGLIGLGKMGKNMALNLIDNGHNVVAYNRTPEAVKEIAKKGAIGVYSLEKLSETLSGKKVFWLMVSDQAVDSVLLQLKPFLKENDLVIDGGNSYYKESIRRAKELREDGIRFLDVGTSGGIYGARYGACMMIGGEENDYKNMRPVFKSMCVRDGEYYCGPAGSGHFVKMVHNGIEYGIMEAYAEGFELLKKNQDFKDLDLRGIANVWDNGSIIESFLLSKIEAALEREPKLKNIIGEVADSGEGRWTIKTAIDAGVDVPVLAQSLFTRFRSREDNTFSDRLLAAIRREFGGHAVKEKK